MKNIIRRYGCICGSQKSEVWIEGKLRQRKYRTPIDSTNHKHNWKEK